MSTKPWRAKAMAAAAGVALAGGLVACAGPAPEPGHSFSEVRLHPVAPPAPPAYLEAAAPTPASQAAVAPPLPPGGDTQTAVQRVQALLAEDGFTVEDRRQGGANLLTATRMAGPKALSEEASCALKAMHRPDFSASDLDVRLDPGGVAVTSRFVLVDTNLISGDLTRQKCRSNGVLETAVRRAAAR